MTGKLSASLRPNAEAAPWVIEAVVRLEQEVERLRAEVAAERDAVVSALERWAEDGGDPWMSYCAARVRSGEHRREEEP